MYSILFQDITLALTGDPGYDPLLADTLGGVLLGYVPYVGYSEYDANIDTYLHNQLREIIERWFSRKDVFLCEVLPVAEFPLSVIYTDPDIPGSPVDMYEGIVPMQVLFPPLPATVLSDIVIDVADHNISAFKNLEFTYWSETEFELTWSFEYTDDTKESATFTTEVSVDPDDWKKGLVDTPYSVKRLDKVRVGVRDVPTSNLTIVIGRISMLYDKSPIPPPIFKSGT